MSCGCLSASLHACTTAPITERRQLKLIPESKLNAQAAQLYEKVKLKAKKYNPSTRKHEVFVEKKLPPHSK